MTTYPVLSFYLPSDLTLTDDPAAFVAAIADHLEQHWPLHTTSREVLVEQYHEGLWALASSFPAGHSHYLFKACATRLPCTGHHPETATPEVLRAVTITCAGWGSDRKKNGLNAGYQGGWYALAKEAVTSRAITQIVARPTQPGLFGGTRHDGTLHYREQPAKLLAAAREALSDGASPYLTLLTVVAPSFRQPDEPELEIFEVDE